MSATEADPFADIPPVEVESFVDETAADEDVATWAPVDLAAVLAGAVVTPEPTLLERSDGVCLLYPGLTHSINGESESGKSMLCQIESARLLAAGSDVVYIDFESDVAQIVDRMRLFGASDADIAGGLTYICPESGPNATAADRMAWEGLMARRPALIVIDGVTEALALFGVSSLDNDELTAWGRAFPRRLAVETGAAVVMVDHVTKSADGRGRYAIGGQAKLSMITGASYSLDVDQPLGRGLRGMVRVYVGKDRPGYVRGHAGDMEPKSRLQEVARLFIDSTDGDVPPVVEILPNERTGSWQPTTLMRKVADYIEQSTAPVSRSAIKGNVAGDERALEAAVDELLDGGYISTKQLGNRSAYVSVRPYL